MSESEVKRGGLRESKESVIILSVSGLHALSILKVYN